MVAAFDKSLMGAVYADMPARSTRLLIVIGNEFHAGQKLHRWLPGQCAQGEDEATLLHILNKKTVSEMGKESRQRSGKPDMHWQNHR